MSESKGTNLTWHAPDITREQREVALGQLGCVLWFTGFSGSGKSTVARRVEQCLVDRGLHAYGLDGDNVRLGLNRDLGFSPRDREENIRRIAAVAQLFADSGCISITSFVSPYAKDRAAARALLPEGRFVLIHVATSIEACEARDPKGLYAKARQGLIPDFTGISAPYDVPVNPEIRLQTEGRTVDECADEVLAWMADNGLLPA